MNPDAEGTPVTLSGHMDTVHPLGLFGNPPSKIEGGKIMQFTKKSKEHIDACRFCWMCHHVCPIGIATGLERNSVRARAMSLSLVARDAIDYSDDIIDNVYECSLCGGCMTDCVTGWDPVMFTREARLGAALDGKLPSYIMDMVQNVLEKGNIYGETDFSKIPEIKKGDILFFLGENTRVKGCAKTAVELLEKAVEEHNIGDEVVLSGSFCIGKCNRIGVTVQVDDDIHTGITRENFKEFFREQIVQKLG